MLYFSLPPFPQSTDKPYLKVASHRHVNVTEGDDLQLNCSARGNPSPWYTWTFLETHPSVVFSSSGDVFTISPVIPADEGQYKCCVSNSVGTVAATFDVVVHGEFEFFVVY